MLLFFIPSSVSPLTHTREVVLLSDGESGLFFSPSCLQQSTEEMVLANRGGYYRKLQKNRLNSLFRHISSVKKCNYKNVLFLLKREKRSESVGIIPAELIFK